MRKLCPKCRRYSVAYDGNREIERCFSYFCDYVMEEKTTKTYEIKRSKEGAKKLLLATN